MFEPFTGSGDLLIGSLPYQAYNKHVNNVIETQKLDNELFIDFKNVISLQLHFFIWKIATFKNTFLFAVSYETGIQLAFSFHFKNY